MYKLLLLLTVCTQLTMCHQYENKLTTVINNTLEIYFQEY